MPRLIVPGRRTEKKLKEDQDMRQGDVLLIRATNAEITGDHREVPRDHGRVVLAYGEVTGHAHALSQPGVRLLAREGVSDRVLIIGQEVEALLQHEEHGAIPVPPGTYLVRIQREWAGEEIRNVQD